MKEQLSWKVGGQQGEGVESTGEIFSIGLNRLGYYLYGYRHFSSRIKGGHTNNKVRVSTIPVNSVSDDLDILVAFDQESIDLNYHELNDQGIIIADSKFNPIRPEACNAALYGVPFTEIAKDISTPLMKNMVAIGASAVVLGIKVESFLSVIKEIFERKGDDVVHQNMKAMQAGYDAMNDGISIEDLNNKLAPVNNQEGRMLMLGNEAIAFGALAAGVRLMPGYPITPATDIMEYLIKKLPDVGGTVVQTEDEIAAVTMAIGANYAGVRSFTASSGPGLSLMMEGIGLAGMTETPLVVVNTQRGGPSTGLPTKQEQSDLMQMIYGTHGEIPKVVIAPSTAEEAFYDTIQAFNIADKYQCPVILLSDLQLSLAKQSVPPFDYDSIHIDRGQVIDEVVNGENKTVYYERFKITESGISNRVLPGTKNGIHHVTGLEHDEEGRPNETKANRLQQMEKRMRKLNSLINSFRQTIIENVQRKESELLVIGFNSTRGAIEEAVEKLRDEGVESVNHVHIRLVQPFPTEDITPFVHNARKILVIENNATSQLANIIKMNVGNIVKFESLLKYDGDPFHAKEIYEKAKELLKNEYVNN